MVFYNKGVKRETWETLFFCYYYCCYWLIKETSWKYFDVFLIHLMSASLERAIPSKVPPFGNPKLNDRPGRSRVNAVCTEIYIWLHKSATSLYDWYVATWRYDCNLLYKIFVLCSREKKPNKWTRSSLWEYLTAFSSIRILNTPLTFIHNALMFFHHSTSFRLCFDDSFLTGIWGTSFDTPRPVPHN